MCGIGGIFNWNKGVGEPEAQSMLQALKHRGPDDLRMKTVAGGVLVHARLAILDPSRGVQPVTSKDGSLSLVFNGEIYNFKELRRELQAKAHVFHTDCDAEVVLAAYREWGGESLKRLTGMFAFAVYDENKRELFLARDRAGIKPLVYAVAGGRFYFASEIQALMTQPEISREIDPRALDEYLHYQYVPEPRTIFRAVKKLPAAHYLKVSAGRMDAESVRYWSLEFTPDETKTEADWLKETGDLLDKVVKDHLISDVPFGAFLSGGIDSSAVVYHMARHLDRPVKTFSIGFDDVSCDESAHAEKIAKKLGCEHRTEILGPESFDIIDKLAAAYGEPFADSSAVPLYYVSKLSAASGVKMVLSGDGGDELFAGYNTYEAILRPETGRRFFEKILVKDNEARLLRAHSRTYAYFQDGERQKLYSRDFSERLDKEPVFDFRLPVWKESRGSDPLSRLQHLDIHTYLKSDILTKVDIASMRRSLEVRVPLLDHRFMEFAATIPARFKMKRSGSSFYKKYLLTEYAAAKISPDLRRPKQGFGIPLADWLSGAFYPKLVERIKDGSQAMREYFDAGRLESYVKTPQAARLHAPKLWALLMLESWRSQFLEKRPEYAHAI